ncbi:DUF349 domain-containing protein [Flavobacterium sp. I3-2]|uniref:DUF349 domain-containing protein n=1 Tax=Flavobacterium sp. I3-2 TaxID=2748319 RepID=UPI0015ADF4A9|nr:DUF349 domain-containing protein [Flavobacterium sp. I3-2]
MLEERNDNLLNTDGSENEQSNVQNLDAIESINESNAEDHENEESIEHVDIPTKDYETLSLEELVTELDKLVTNYNVMTIRDHVEQIKKVFSNKYYIFIEEKKQTFLDENAENTILDFEYNSVVKNNFDAIFNTYRNKKNKYFQSIQDNLKNNLANRKALIEELKNLIDNTDNISTALKDVQNIRERWGKAGAIPRDNYNHVWNNYHFYMERFYDQLHLDREARDWDFKQNLEKKQNLIESAKKLLEQNDIHKAFKELQIYHRIWKEQIGPVSKEHRDLIWNEFSDITKQLHDKREAIYVELRLKEEQNLNIKVEFIAQLNDLAKNNSKSHNQWQDAIAKVEELRAKFFKTGKVPTEHNEQTWDAFKEATRLFNVQKNAFYKDIKRDQQENLNLKMALIEKAKSLNTSNDFDRVTPIMKQVQEDWKKIGHVPKKYSDKLWKEFKEACNHYFDRLHQERNKNISEEMENFDKKKAYLEDLKDFQLVGNHKTDLDAIKQHIENWKAIGSVPQVRRHIEGKFNKILDALFDKLSLSKKETELVKYNNRLEQMVESGDKRKLQNEITFVQRKIEEITSEIFQLENNMQFISNAKSDNPFIKEINKNIEKHRDELNIWKDKLNQLKEIL